MASPSIRCQKCLSSWLFLWRGLDVTIPWLYWFIASSTCLTFEAHLIWSETSPTCLVSTLFSSFFVKSRFSSSQVDLSLLLYHSLTTIVYLLLYVNDMVITGKILLWCSLLLHGFLKNFPWKIWALLTISLDLKFSPMIRVCFSIKQNMYLIFYNVLTWLMPSLSPLYLWLVIICLLKGS